MFNQDTWMSSRLGKFTASEIGNLLTESKKKDEVFGATAKTYIHKKIHEILSGETKELPSMAALEWGKSLENEAIMVYEAQTGYKVENLGGANPKFFEFGERAGGSPDGLIESTALIERDRGQGVLEVKCPYTGETMIDYLLFNTGADLLAYNKNYYAQVQFNMVCTNTNWANWVAYDPRINMLKIVHIDRDNDYCDKLIERVELATVYVDNILNIING